MATEELAQLARELRRRLEQSDESEWMTPGALQVKASQPADVPAPEPAHRASLEAIAAEILSCRACPLGATRIKAVPGVGSAQARVMFVGEGPGFDEDHQGEPFVGKSGQLLDKILESIGLSRAAVFIANVVKCHPMKDPSNPELRGNDRPPAPEEMAACRKFLDGQIEAIGPEIIVTLGSVATKALLGDGISITRIRGQWREYAPQGGKPVRLLPTFHPAALLRDPGLKKDVWTDMKNLKKELEPR